MQWWERLKNLKQQWLKVNLSQNLRIYVCLQGYKFLQGQYFEMQNLFFQVRGKFHDVHISNKLCTPLQILPSKVFCYQENPNHCMTMGVTKNQPPNYHLHVIGPAAKQCNEIIFFTVNTFILKQCYEIMHKNTSLCVKNFSKARFAKVYFGEMQKFREFSFY